MDAQIRPEQGPVPIQARSGGQALAVTVSLGALLNPLNSSMIAVALVALRHQFAVSFAAVSWLISAFYLASAVGQPVTGRFSDRHGRKRIFMGGLLVLGVASAVAPLAPSFGWLVVARIAQAAGSAALFPTAIGFIRDCVREGRARALGVLNVFAAASAGAGPTLAGFLIEAWGWEAIFLVNIPFVAVPLLLGRFTLPSHQPRQPAAPKESLWHVLDVPGLVLFACAIGLPLWFLLSLTARPVWLALLGGMAAAATFHWHEHRTTHPFIDVRRLAAHRRLLVIYGHFTVTNMFLYTIFFGLPTFLQEAHGFGPADVGLIMLPLAALGIFGTPVAAIFIERSGTRSGLVIAAGCMMACAVLIWFVGPAAELALLVTALVLLGAANAFNQLGAQAALYVIAPRDMIGGAAGLLGTCRYLGAIAATSMLGVVFGDAIGPAQLRELALILAVLSGVALLASRHAPGRAGGT